VEDQSPRRFVQLVLGMVLGFAAWGLSDLLLLELPYNPEIGFDEPLVGEMLDMSGTPFDSGRDVPLAMFVGYFGFLMLALRWWTQAEWTRYTRLSIWAVAVAAVFAYLLHTIWWFPQPAGLMLAAVTAISVQLSSPWLSMSRRREIVQQLHSA
jgi:hypothetical protein